jgi:hypothetical protein
MILIRIEFGSGRLQASSSFFEKKNQKTFDSSGTRCIQRAP